MSTQQIAEVQDVKFLAFEEREVDGKAMLCIRGLVFHSAIAVESIRVQRAGDIAHVLVTLTEARPDLSGGFKASVDLSGGVRTVLFGNIRTPIWRQKLINVTLP